MTGHTAQTVTVTAKEDVNAVSETVEVTHAAASADSAYNTLTVDAVTVIGDRQRLKRR